MKEERPIHCKDLNKGKQTFDPLDLQLKNKKVHDKSKERDGGEEIEEHTLDCSRKASPSEVGSGICSFIIVEGSKNDSEAPYFLWK